MLLKRCVVVIVGLALLVTASCGRVLFPTPEEDATTGERPPDIDLSEYVMTFEEEFDELDVSGWGCDTRWIAHTPYGGDFGAAGFENPSRNFPFITRNGILRIEARKMPTVGWRAGLLSSWNPCDEGFTQQYGYFEIRTKLPRGKGFWPAFWLLTTDRTERVAEIDVFEYHSLRPNKVELALHIHPMKEGVERYHAGHHEFVEPYSLADRFNTFGVDVSEDELVFYLNRREIWRKPTLPEFRQPLYILLNLAMDGGEITDETPNSDFMYVDYVRVYARK